MNIILEGVAAKKAHSLGLVAMGGGRWGKNGKAVAKTVQGKLVSLKGTGYTSATHNAHKKNKTFVGAPKSKNKLKKKVTKKAVTQDDIDAFTDDLGYSSPNLRKFIFMKIGSGSTTANTASYLEDAYGIGPGDAEKIVEFIKDPSKIAKAKTAKTKVTKIDVDDFVDKIGIPFNDNLTNYVYNSIHNKATIDNSDLDYIQMTYNIGWDKAEMIFDYMKNPDLAAKFVKQSNDNQDHARNVINDAGIDSLQFSSTTGAPDLHKYLVKTLNAFKSSHASSKQKEQIEKFITHHYKINSTKARFIANHLWDKNLKLSDKSSTKFVEEKITVPKMSAPLKKALQKAPILTILKGFKLDGMKEIGGEPLFDYIKNNTDSYDDDYFKHMIVKMGLPKKQLPKFLGVMKYISDNSFQDPNTSHSLVLLSAGIKKPRYGELLSITSKQESEIWKHADDFYGNKADKNKLNVKGQTIKYANPCSIDDLDISWSEMPTFPIIQQMQKSNIAEAKRQSEWRYKALDEPTRKKLRMTQEEWQATGQHSKDPEFRKKRNEFLNNTLKGPPPVEIKVDKYVERGMSMSIESAKKFLSHFQVGKEALLPPSGWSGRPDVARNFTNAFSSNNVSVLLRLMPKDGKIHGLTLPWADDAYKPPSKVEPKRTLSKIEFDKVKAKYYANKISWNEYEPYFKKWDKESPHFEYDEGLSQKENDYMANECELIRPGWAKNKVLSVNKIIETDPDNSEIKPQVKFEIVMQEMGKSKTQKILESVESKELDEPKETPQEKLERLKTVFKYTNTSIHQDIDESNLDILVHGN